MSIQNTTLRICQIGGLSLLFSLVFHPLIADAQEERKVDFATTIKPIFEQHCLSCHGKKDPEAFRIDVKDETMDYVEAGSAEDSNLYQVLVSDDEDELMPPPDDENPLSKEQIQSVMAWIDQGAEWPDNVKIVAPVAVKPPATEGSPNGAEAGVGPEAGHSASTGNTDGDDAKLPVVDPKTERVFNAIGSLHPAAVHLPIGLLLASGLFALFSLRGNFVMSDCAYYCLWLGTVGAIIGCVSGWWFSPMEGKGTVRELNDLWDMDHPVFWHRTSAIVITILAFLMGLFAASARNRDPDDGILWKLGLILLAMGVGWVGHEGGELTHGKHHYDDLKAIGADLFPSLFPEEAEEAEPINPVEPKVEGGEVKAQDELGKTSDET